MSGRVLQLLARKCLQGGWQSSRLASTLTTTQQILPLCYLSEEEAAFKDAVSRFARDKVAPFTREMEEKGRVHPEVLKGMFSNGLMSTLIPTEYGGAGGNFMTTLLMIEEIAKVDPAVSILSSIQNGLVAKMIMVLGTKEQKEIYLTGLAKDKVGSFCLSEASSGSDAFAMKTTAKADGDDFILNGTKMWISNSDVAEIFIVFCNADPSKGYRGITTFIIDGNTPGLTIGPPEKKLGLKASGTCPVHFENVRVPKSAILGELYKGYQYAAGYLNESRFGVGAQMLGISEACFDLTVPYTLERKQFGQSIYDFQGLQHQIADLAVRIECARLLVYNGARLVEAGLPFAKEASMAKYYASELAQEVTRKCIDWMGGVGFTTAFLQEKFFRDCKVGTIYEGTTNMQLNTIAKALKKEYS